MDFIEKALWFVEAHSSKDIDLEQVAKASRISPFHLTRAFAEVFGVSLMRYARSRRLSQAAKELAAGAPDILAVALGHGYGSHEAFTRAFKREFGRTPECVRTSADLSTLKLTEAIIMRAQPVPVLKPPRLEWQPATCYVGLVARYDCKSPAGIPNQWQRFTPYLGTIRNQVGMDAYGVCFNMDEEGCFDYMTGVAVGGGSEVPHGLLRLGLPAQRYAVFHHDGHIAEIRSVINAIWSDGLAESGYEPVPGPTLEKYGPKFDGRTGLGGYAIWIAVR